MPRFDVYANPDPAERKLIPYFLDLQNQVLDSLETRVAAPLCAPHGLQQRLRNLHPELTVDGRTLIMDTPAIAALPITELRRPVANIADQQLLIQDALDTLFGSY